MTIHTLDTIRLNRFIDLWLGDTDAVVAEGEATDEQKQRAARELCEQYIGIVGGTQVQARLAQENERLKLRMRRICLETARALIATGDLDNARKVLRSAGLPSEGDAAVLRLRIDGWLAKDCYKEKKAQEAQEQAEGGARMTRDWFTRERVAVMRWAKMYVDERQMSASEYAWLVRAMCDDVRRSMNEQRRLKQKRHV